ncbi:MAG: holo-ACP synthase [Verrucomicrobiota bacterium]|nr:holo-ACP synthase [Verrucomicrobiota bacterium]
MKILGIGVDIVETARIEAAIARQGERFLARVFTEAERHYCASIDRPARCYGARFAAKEAVSKALGTGIGPQINWNDIEVRRKASGEPFVALRGDGAALAKRRGVIEWFLSLSHSEHYAVAQVIAVGSSGSTD